jgi:hypothetical protein
MYAIKEAVFKSTTIILVEDIVMIKTNVILFILAPAINVFGNDKIY